jgi:Cd2+/Zn2+-exporting ATPase
MFTPRGELRGAIAAGVLLGVGVGLGVAGVWWGLAAIWLSLAIGMVYGGRAAVESLREGRFDIDVLMVVGAGLAAYIGHPEEGALLLFLFTLAGALEELASQRTTREVEALQKLMPLEALVLRAGDGGEWVWVEARAETLVAGERIRVRPGERVPADARVVEGASSMDQSAITGESMPRDVGVGDELFAGTINADNALEAEVVRPARESSVQKILELVLRAREQREPAQRLIDRLSQPYAVGVMAISGLVFVVWWLALGFVWTQAAYVAITLLIVASPCALVIATPTATLAAVARGARGGILFKGGQAIEALARVRAVALDKTGTLTFGRPTLYEVHPVAWSRGPDMLALAAGLERDSTHPIATAILAAAKERGVAAATVEDVDHTAGRGLAGTWTDPATGARGPARLGSYRHVEPLVPMCLRQRVRDVLARIQGRGHLGVVVAAGDGTEEGGQVAVLIMADAVRPGARELVPSLHAMGIKPVVMLTGDHAQTASRVATGLGLDEFRAELMPGDKVEQVRELRERIRRETPRAGVVLIGDGVNDAPALAAADASIAVGTIGTAAALESAGAVLLSDSLVTVPWAIGLARRCRRTIALNFVFALSVIGIMGVVTLVGSVTGYRVPLSLGVLAHEGGTLLVVLNSLLLLRVSGPARGVDSAGAGERGHGATAGRPVTSP